MASSSSVAPNPNASHKLLTGCMLSALPCCCSCADRRPEATAYPVYIDGKGIRMQGQRWQRYCRKCCDYWSSLASTSHSLSPTADATTLPLSANATTELTTSGPYHNSQPLRSTDQNQHSALPLPPNDLSASRNAPGQTQHEITATGPPSSLVNRNQREQAYPLGSREDVQQEDYESPLAGMFGRAYGRYREAEAARQAAQMSRNQALLAIAQDGSFHDLSDRFSLSTLNPLLDPSFIATGQQAREEQGRVQGEVNRLYEARHIAHRMTEHLERSELQPEPGTRNTENDRPSQGVGFMAGNPPTLPVLHLNQQRRRHGFHRQFYTNPFETSLRIPQDDNLDEDTSVNRIDLQTSRPSPSKSEDLKVDFGCKVCTEQKINTICMPCMHACMCRWCASIHKDDCRDYEGRWIGTLWKCPICRKQITEVKRFYI